MELGYSQSAVTAQVKSLESMLGARLFDRSRSGVTLTPSGERFLPYATRLLKLAEEAKADIATAHGRLASSTLRIGANETVTTYRLPTLVTLFHDRYPDVRLSPRVYRGGPRALLKSLVHNEIDIALFHSATDPVTDLEVARVLDEDVVLVAPAGHPLEGLDIVTASDLRRTRMLITRTDCVYSRIVEAQLGGFDRQDVPPLQFGTLEAVKNAIAAPRGGVSALPRIAVGDLLAGAKVSELRWTPPARVGMYATWHETFGASEPLRALIELLTDPAPDVRSVIGIHDFDDVIDELAHRRAFA